jgi:hypothetical protein
MEKQFEVQQGLDIQAKQLAQWKSILKDEVYEALYEYATRNHSEAKTGWDICRGTSLDNYIGNYMLGNRM